MGITYRFNHDSTVMRAGYALTTDPYSGGNPVDAVRHYADRLLYVHFKDVKAAGNATGYEFVELGQGTVDLPAVVEALRAFAFAAGRSWNWIKFPSDQEEHQSNARLSARVI